MRKEYTITNRLILNFLILSVISITVIFIVYVLYSRGEGKEYSMLSYFLVSMVFYKSYIPYITALSVHFSFFKGKYVNQENISKVISIPIASIVILVAFYTLYDYYFVNYLIANIKNHNANRDYMVYYEYELKLRDEAYEKAKEELAVGNLDKANTFAEEALFYDKNDGNVILLLKSIQEEKRKKYENTHQTEINNINNLIKSGTRQFTLGNYSEALKYFNRVLSLDNNNPLALYYLNRISIARNEKPKYKGNTTEEISVYGRLSEAIALYDNGRLNIRNTNLNLNKIYEDYKYITNNQLLLNSFIEDYKNGDITNIEENENNIILTVQTDINKYIVSKNLIIDKNTGKPRELQIKDGSQNTLVYILYNRIEVNGIKEDKVLS